MDDLRVVPVIDAPWDDVRTVFGTRGDPSRCWCQYFKVDAPTWNAQDVPSFERALCDQIDRARVEHGAGPGVLAYAGTEPVGWAAVEPAEAYTRILQPTQTENTWVVSCFVVRVGHRRKGVAVALLDGAVQLARTHGARAVEAFPVDAATAAVSSADLYHGPLSTFEAAGFATVSRPRPGRAVVRLEL